MQALLRPLEAAVLAHLRQSPAGIEEHALLKALARDGLLPDPFTDSRGLFRAHFLLFHCLYRLRDRLRAEHAAELAIDPLCLRLQPYRRAEPGLAAQDRLRDYYLDLTQLESTTEGDVLALLAAFYAGLRTPDRRARALAELGLADPVSDTQIKRAYRRLVMTHHPDRGGDAARLQDLNAAMRVLFP